MTDNCETRAELQRQLMISIDAVAELKRERGDDPGHGVDRLIELAEQWRSERLQAAVDHLREHGCGSIQSK